LAAAGELANPEKLPKKPETVLVVCDPAAVTLVLCNTLTEPNFSGDLPARPAKTSGPTLMFGSEQVRPLAAIGIVVELLTMLPLTTISDT
jgi:hypothetical protein